MKKCRLQDTSLSDDTVLYTSGLHFPLHQNFPYVWSCHETVPVHVMYLCGFVKTCMHILHV